MDTLSFPSGEWVGYYVYHKEPQKFLMDLILTFDRGVISGDGLDDVGLFSIEGHFNAAEGECVFQKHYQGMHSVEYKGYREGKGIWGTWSLPGAKGGFQIWPLSQGEAFIEEAAETLSLPTRR